MTTITAGTDLFSLATKALLNTGTGKAALDLLTNAVAGTPEIAAVKTLATIFEEIHNIGETAGGPTGAQFGAQQLIQKGKELETAVDTLKPILGENSEQWQSLSAIVEGLQTGTIDLHDLDSSALTDLQELTGHLETIHNDLNPQQASPSPQNGNSSPAQDSNLIITKGYQALLQSTIGSLTPQAVTLLTGQTSDPATMQARTSLQTNLQNLSDGIAWQDGKTQSQITSVLNILKDPDKQLTHEDLKNLEATLSKFTTATEVDKQTFDETKKVHVTTDKTINGLIEGVITTVNSSPIIKMLLSSSGIDIGQEASKLLENGLSVNFKNCILKAMKGEEITDGDLKKLTDTENSVFSVAKLGIEVGRWIPKGAINWLIGLSETSSFMNIPFIGHALNGLLRKITGPISMMKPLLAAMDNMHNLLKDLSPEPEQSNQPTQQQGQPKPAPVTP